MILTRILLRIFPAPRRRVTVRSVLPLVIFAAAFVGTWFFLELRGIVRFSSTTPLLLLLTLPWVWWMSVAGFSGLGRARRMMALITRMALLGVFIMLLAEPRAVRTSDILSVVYALDVSDSIGEQAQDRALEYVTQTVVKKPQKDEAGLVVFGRNAAVELPPRITFPFEVITSRITKDGTNIADALSLAGAILPEKNQGRIILISDGAYGYGNLTRVLDDLTSRDITVDVLPVEYDYTHEVWLEKLELPRFVKEGETYEASIILSTLRAGRGKLTLRENGEAIFSQDVDYNPGKNRYTLPLYMRSPGYYEYVAAIQPPRGKDGWEQNNKAINYLYLKGRGKVLVVIDSSPDAEARDWETLTHALKRTGRVVELRQGYEFPRDALSLMPYDCVVFVNVPADVVDPVSQAALATAVFNQGVGFLMVGGKNSFGPGGYHRTKVEEILPVTMDISQKKVLPKGALAIILHTCEIPEGNVWGKRIAKEAIRVLGARDEVGILAYGQGGEGWIFPLTPAGEYERLFTLINKAWIGDMPSFATTMQLGLTGLRASDAATKHMIVISDGDPQPPTPKLISGFRAAKISISTIAIYPHGGSDISMMQSIAAATGGRYYYPKSPKKLPSIFIKEAKTLRRSMIQNKVFTPETRFPSHIMKGISAVPQLRGYVLTTPKGRANVILEDPEKEEDEINPVLAVWRCGLARTAAFTSDLSPNWARDWVEWDRYQAFVNQLMTDISRVEHRSDLYMRTFAAGSEGIIVVEDHGSGKKRRSLLEIVAQVAGPRQKTKTVELKQVGPGRYQGRFELWGKGQYQVAARGIGDGRDERAMSGFALPYSSEYMRFRSNPVVLEQIARQTGGRILTGRETPQKLFGEGRKPKESTRPIFDWFLIALTFLLLLDVGVRRIQIDLALILSALRRKKETSGETLSALLRLKQRIKYTPEEKEVAQPLFRKRGFREAESKVAVPPPPPGVKETAGPKEERPPVKKIPKPKEPKERKPLSTTQQLLERKKKWKRDDHEEN